MLSSDDPLDSDDFDAIAYINSYFPTESSMKRLEPFVARVDANIVQLDEDISRAVQVVAASPPDAVFWHCGRWLVGNGLLPLKC